MLKYVGLISLALLSFSGKREQDTQGISLEKMKFVTEHEADWNYDKFSIKDRIFKVRLTKVSYRDWPIFAVFDLDKRFGQLRATCGIPDHFPQDQLKRKSWFKIYLDGEIAIKGEFGKDKFLTPINLDLTGASSLRVELDNCVLADPMLYIAPPKAPVVAPRIIEPKNNEVLSGTATLKWASMDGATAYGIELINISLDSDEEAADRIFSFTVRGRNSFELDTRKLPAGNYRWSVIAFESRKNLSGFSAERTFTVKR